MEIAPTTPNPRPTDPVTPSRLCPPILTILCLASCVGSPPAETESARPHILLISIDTLRADHLSSYGYRRHTSPFLDRLAAQGTRFSRAFANTHGTPPSHVTLFTSLYQETHRVSLRRQVEDKQDRVDHVVPGALRLLPELLQDAGYATVAVTGKGFVSSSFGFDQGFDSFREVPLNIRVGTKAFVTSLRRSLRQGKPVFAFFHTYETHSPYLPPRRYRRLFGSYASSFVPTSAHLRPIQDNAGALTEEDLLFVEASYDAGIRYTDDHLRRLFEQLEELQFLDRALVVIVSDHGEEFGEHGGLLHRVSLHDELLHVPLILLGREVPQAVVDPRLVSLIDVAPTILAAAGVAPSPQMAGKDLLSPLEDERPEDTAVFSQYADLLYSIRTQRWKLIEDRRTRSLQLYDLRLDPGEHDNLSGRRPDVTKVLASRLARWRQGLPVIADGESALPTLDEAEIERLRSLGYLD